MQDAPSVIVGGIQYTAQDPLPSPIIAVAYSTKAQSSSAARLILTLHNGVRPFSTGPAIYAGDTNVKVRVRPSLGRILVQVYAYAKPKHLTCAFYAASHVEVGLYKAFRNLVEMHRTYTLTVAAEGEYMLKELDLLKYTLDEKEVKI